MALIVLHKGFVMFKSLTWRRLIFFLVCVFVAGQFLFADEEEGPVRDSRRGRRGEQVAIEAGDTAADFELPRLTIEKDKDGNAVGKISEKKVKLSSYRGKKPVFLVFSSYT